MNPIDCRESGPLRVAVVGTGIAGMSAAWLLNQSHQVTVYEKNDRIGGHSNTVDVVSKSGTTPVDTGFIVYNELNYPNLTALFRHLDVATEDSEMSFAVSLMGGHLEYSGTNLNGLLGQRRNIVAPVFWQMIADLLRFYREAARFRESPLTENLSLGDYCRMEGYGDRFIENHLLPMGAAIWSTSLEDMRDYPITSFIRFFKSHGLLLLSNRPKWKTVTGGSREYVKRLTAPFRQSVLFGGVRAIRRFEDRVLVEDCNGTIEAYDHVVLATHADDALALLSDRDTSEEALLGPWRYTQNRAVLHQDASLMPQRQRVWSSWNFLSGPTPKGGDGQCVTYWMNRLQSLPRHDPHFVTLNPIHEPQSHLYLREFDYKHPLFDQAALNSQKNLWWLQGHRRTWYCGSYFGYGFHEDALQSGLAVAEKLGGKRRPWRVAGENGRLTLPESKEAAVA